MAKEFPKEPLTRERIEALLKEGAKNAKALRVRLERMHRLSIRNRMLILR
jgi:hypothetical protein